jgi:integrase
VEFPVQVSKTTRKPHYMTASEQERILFFAPVYLRNAVAILVETGLRPYKELMPMQKSQVDLQNRLVYIRDSKTSGGVGELPLTDEACEAFRTQMEARRGAVLLALRIAAHLRHEAERRRGSGSLRHADVAAG